MDQGHHILSSISSSDLMAVMHIFLNVEMMSLVKYFLNFYSLKLVILAKIFLLEKCQFSLILML